MLFKCGHNEPAGVGKNCMTCHLAQARKRITDLPKIEKASFTNTVNERRKKRRLKKKRMAGKDEWRECKWCGKMFEVDRSDQVYCCKDHQALASNERYKLRNRKKRAENKPKKDVQNG